MTNLSTTLIIVGLVVLGAGLGWRRPFSQKLADRGMFFALFLLLMLMGFSTAHVPNIELHWSLLGISALLGSVLPLVGTWLTHLLGRLIFHHREEERGAATKKTSPNGEKPCLLCVFRLPALLIFVTAAGFFFGWQTRGRINLNSDIALNTVLSILVFLVGYNFGYARKPILPLLMRWKNLIYPLLTIAGSLLAGFLLPPLTGWKLSESLALVSGMGWYSLSSGLITSMGNPLLGSAAFLANLFRESFSLLLIPGLIRLGFSSGAVGSPGAASMDVALPLIEKFGGVDLVPLALAHGLLVTVAVPPLVILWMNLGF